MKLQGKMRVGKGGLYKYGDHLTPGLAGVRVYAAGLTSFLAGFFRFRAGGLAGIPALKTSWGVLPSILRPRWGLRVL